MGNHELSQVQIANLNMLTLIAECARGDSAGACSQFGLNAEQAEFVASLALQDLLMLVAHLGDECLFPPRSDLIQILAWPPQLAGALLMVHPPPKHAAQAGAPPAAAP
jgi:hypothetical protein